jgi:dipeptidyl aminopeptidase/acylaminoacyl peptidase
MRRLLVLAVLAVLAAAALAPSSAAAAELVAAGSDGVWLLSDDGTIRTRISPRYVADVAWSPDGERIVVDTRSGLAIGPVDGPLTKLPGTDRLREPAWSPDGKTIAATRSAADTGRTDIVLLPAEGGTPVPVPTGGEDAGPAWSPDGSLLAFSHHTGSGDSPSDLVVARRDGSELRTVAKQGFSPSWSPDGTRIAYATVRDANGETCVNEGTEDQECSPNGELYVVGADGTGDRRLTNTPAGEGGPAWSPDGARIAFESDRRWKTSELFVMDADGSCVAQISLGSGFLYSPAWRPGRLPVRRPACGSIAPFTAGYDIGEVLRERDTVPLFPGIPFGGMYPVEVGSGYVAYDECGLAERSRCVGPLSVSTYTTCKRNPAGGPVSADRVETIKGALVLHYIGRVHVISGGTTTILASDEGKLSVLRRMVRALRPVSRPDRVPRRLPKPQLPARAWRALERSPVVRRNGIEKKAKLIASDRRILAALRRLHAGRRPACAR